MAGEVSDAPAVSAAGSAWGVILLRCNAAVVVRTRVEWIETNRFGKVRDRFIVLAFLYPSVAAVVVGFGRLRGYPEGFVEVRDSQ